MLHFVKSQSRLLVLLMIICYSCSRNMEINDVYTRSSMAQRMCQQITSVGLAGANAPLVPTASTYAVLGEVGVLEPEETFNINGTDKINKLNKSKELSRLGTVKSQYYDPFLHLYKGSGGKRINRINNPSLSFIRGEPGQNLPLYENAIYMNGGRVAAKLNLVG